MPSSSSPDQVVGDACGRSLATCGAQVLGTEQFLAFFISAGLASSAVRADHAPVIIMCYCGAPLIRGFDELRAASCYSLAYHYAHFVKHMQKHVS